MRCGAPVGRHFSPLRLRLEFRCLHDKRTGRNDRRGRRAHRPRRRSTFCPPPPSRGPRAHGLPRDPSKGGTTRARSAPWGSLPKRPYRRRRFARRRTYQCERASCVRASAEDSFNLLLPNRSFWHECEPKPRGETGCGRKIFTSRNPASASRDSHSASSQNATERGVPGLGILGDLDGQFALAYQLTGHETPARLQYAARLNKRFWLIHREVERRVGQKQHRRCHPQRGCSPCLRPANAGARCNGLPPAPRARGEASGGAISSANNLAHASSLSLTRRASSPAPHPNSTAVRTPLRSTPSSRYPQPQ